MTANESTTRVVSESGNDAGPGQRLREAREAAQLTLGEVASRMRLEPYVLELLENDHYERLHGPTFVRGYLSGYARLLDLPERPILEAYERHGYGPPALVSELGRKPEVHVSDFPVRMVTYVIAGLLVVLVVLWWQSRQPQTATPERAQTTAEPEPQTSATSPSRGESEDVPAASAGSSMAADNSQGVAPVTETTEPAQALSEGADEGDKQQPQPAASTEQSTASEAAYVEVPPTDQPMAGEPPSQTRTSTEDDNATASITTEATAEPVSENANSAEGDTGGEAHSPAESVVTANASADAAEGDGATSTSEPGEETAQPPRPAPLPGSDRLAIQLARESWVEIYDRGGGRLYYSLAQEGSQVVVQGAGPMRVLLGDVDGAAVAYNGEPYDLSRYQGRSVVHFTVGELSATTPPEPPAAPEPAAAREPLTRQTPQPTAPEQEHSVADASGLLVTPAVAAPPVQEGSLPATAPEVPQSALDVGRPDS
jgi:cytoskeleton protein RodZ